MADRMQSLEAYIGKRDFSRTSEPRAGRKRKARTKGAFVVQKHDARRLHFDFRLEWNGVLLSWAVTRGPSLDPRDKRLAVRTEDHPLDYGAFEGTIPKGQYGGGTVMVWDRGNWTPETDPEKGLEKGHLKFTLAGERMKGGWNLVRMDGRNDGKRENWLLIKSSDEFASEDRDLVAEHLTSVKTGRKMRQIAENEEGGKPAPKETGRKRAATGGKQRRSPTRSGTNPPFQDVQLATLVDDAPQGDGWIHETKFDGYRALASVGRDGVTIFTRKGLDWTDRYNGPPETLAELNCRSALIDGEVISGRPDRAGSSFSALQNDLEGGREVIFMAFDLLFLDGKDLRDQPIEARKKKLRALIDPLPKDAAVRYSEHVTGHGTKVFEAVAKAGGEGIISKKAGSRYSGRRNRNWLKIKATRRQEFVIGGYSPSSAMGRPFASLLLGTYEAGRLVYRGRVGTGFDEAKLEEIGKLMRRRQRMTAAFDQVPKAVARSAEWIRPDLVAEIDFAELTSDGMVRHAAFVGLRGDKTAEDVTLEGDNPKSSGTSGDAVTIAGVEISSPDRIVFEGAGVTKADIARYYAAASQRLLDLAGNRPLSLLRCPSGTDGDCFFQKHAGKGFPDEIDTVEIEESSGDTEPYMQARKAKAFVAAAQMGTIEFHIWGARTDDLKTPDRIVFDLDPADDVAFGAVKEAAADIGAFLDGLGLPAVPMVTGGKGVHVIVPLRRIAGWDTVKTFARTVASHFAGTEPERFTASMSKARRRGRIFIDWLRNDRGSTSVAPYSLRNRPGAPVAVPLTWNELGDIDAPHAFTHAATLERLESACPLLQVKATRSISAAVVSKLEDAVAGGLKD